MALLGDIIALKHSEVKRLKTMKPVSELQKNLYFERETLSLSNSILKENSAGIIAEFKRRSPSAGVLNTNRSPAEVASDYYMAGATAVSVLTDTAFFGGSVSDLEQVRSVVNCPVLRKDFIIDEYQVIEAKASGADAILLITGVLSPNDLKRFHKLAVSLGMEVIVEIHEKKNISTIPEGARTIGINNRNLSTLSVSLDNSEELITLLPRGIVKVAESGIRSPADYSRMKKAGFDGFLIGEYFMRNSNPGLACKKLISEIHDNEDKN